MQAIDSTATKACEMSTERLLTKLLLVHLLVESQRFMKNSILQTLRTFVTHQWWMVFIPVNHVIVRENNNMTFSITTLSHDTMTQLIIKKQYYLFSLKSFTIIIKTQTSTKIF